VTLREDDSEELMPLADTPGQPRRSWRAIAHIRHLRTPKWWQEILFIGISYALYSTVRNAVPGHKVAAFHRATSILNFERDLHLDIERSLNKIVAGAPWLAYVSSYWYAVMHFIVTIGVLVWLYVRHPLRYRPIRSVLYITNILALAGFWFYALAPPRLLPGFVDTVDKYPTLWLSWNTNGVAKLSNQFAAMPSLHIGWSTWCGIVLFRLAKRRTTRVLAVAYPLITVFVILGTANHFLLDAVGGLVVLGLSFLIQRLVFGRGAFDSPAQVRRASPWQR
jgi:PAP2 superfamily